MPNNKDPLDMSEVLQDLEMGGHNDMDFEDEVPVAAPLETIEERVRRLEGELANAERAALMHFESLRLLMSICKERGFEPFPGESMPLTKPISEMTTDELMARNKEASARVVNRRVNSAEKLAPPTPEQMEAMYTPKAMSPAFAALFDTLKSGQSEVTFEQLNMYVKAVEESQS